MDTKDLDTLDDIKRYLKAHKFEIIMIIIAMIIGSSISYYLWRIDFW